MNSTIDIFLLIILALTQFWQLVKVLMRYKEKWFTPKVWMVSIFLSVALLPILETIKLLDQLSLYYILKIQNTLFGLLGFSILASISLAIIKNVTSKKIKTLWRLPIIGILIGYYLTINDVLYVYLCIEIVIAIILFIKRNEYRFYYRSNMKSFVAFLILTLLLYSGVSQSLVLLFMFFIYYYFKVIVINTATVSYWLKFIKNIKGNL